MADLKSTDVGKRVIYIGNYNGPQEAGVITSIREDTRVAFVRYGADVNSKATKFDDLVFDSSVSESRQRIDG